MTKYRARLTFEIKLISNSMSDIFHIIDELSEDNTDAELYDFEYDLYKIHLVEYYYPSNNYYDPPEYDMEDFDTEDTVMETVQRIIKDNKLNVTLINVYEGEMIKF